MMRPGALFFGLAICVAAFSARITVHGLAGPNEPLADNELGLTSKDCSSHCDNKDGLLLWIASKDVCDASLLSSSSPSSSSPISSSDHQQRSQAQLSSSVTENKLWSPVAVGSLSAVFALVGMMIGLETGRNNRRAAADASKY